MSKALKKAKNKYFDSMFSDHMLLDIALGIYDDMQEEPTEAVSEEALTCFCAGNSYGVKKYESLEPNIQAANAFIQKNYPYLRRFEESKNKYTIPDDKIKSFESQVTIISVEGFDVGRLRNEYLMELVRGRTHEKALESLSGTWTIKIPKKKAPKKSG